MIDFDVFSYRGAWQCYMEFNGTCEMLVKTEMLIKDIKLKLLRISYLLSSTVRNMIRTKNKDLNII